MIFKSKLGQKKYIFKVKFGSKMEEIAEKLGLQSRNWGKNGKKWAIFFNCPKKIDFWSECGEKEKMGKNF